MFCVRIRGGSNAGVYTETPEGALYSVLNCDFQMDHLEFGILLGLFFYMNYAVVW